MKDSRLDTDEMMILVSVGKISIECYIDMHDECKETQCICKCHL